MSRVGSLLVSLSKRHNDTLAMVDAAELARRFRLPVHFVQGMVDGEIKRRLK